MREKLATYYRIAIVLIAGYGLYINFKLISFRYGILYFTNLSNGLCFLLFLFIVVRSIMKQPYKINKYYMIKGMVTMLITLTMLVYNSCLVFDSSTNIFIGHELETNIVHLAVPTLVILDYILFDEKGHVSINYPIFWTIPLILYIIASYIYIGLGGKYINNSCYPYPFMSFNEYGVIGVATNLFILVAMYIGFGYLIQKVDEKVAQKNKK